MSPIDLSQAEAEAELFSGEDQEVDVGAMMAAEETTSSSNSNNHVEVVHNDTDVAAAESDDEEFMDANDSFVNNLPTMFGGLGPLPLLAEQYREGSNFGTLERCGRWLMAIPRNDVVALQQTIEYRRFLEAFDKLGEVCYILCFILRRFIVLHPLHDVHSSTYYLCRHIGEP
jgi:hypothetical protein